MAGGWDSQAHARAVLSTNNTEKKTEIPEVDAARAVVMTKQQGLSLTGLVKQLTKTVIETAPEEGMTGGHLGYEKGDPARKQTRTPQRSAPPKTG